MCVYVCLLALLPVCVSLWFLEGLVNQSEFLFLIFRLKSIFFITNPLFLFSAPSKVSNIIAGAVGAAGVAVLAPTAGLMVGTKQGGIVGGAIGLAGELLKNLKISAIG